MGSTSSTWFDRSLSIVVTLCAVAITIVLINREWAHPAPPDEGARYGQPQPLSEPVYLDEWADLDAVGVEIVTGQSDVQISMFMDLECPFCARFDQEVLSPFLEQADELPTVRYVHLPLRMHRFALPAAHAAECAYAQGRFTDFTRAIYARQDSLGLMSWEEFASVADVPDSQLFLQCMERELPERVAAGRAWADSLGISGTPTVIIDGWLLPSPPGSPEELSAAISIVRQEVDP